MKLTKVQNRYINNKSLSVSILKGKSFTGKTMAAIYRMMNLENNYCIYNEDNILYITCNNEKVEAVKEQYREKNNKNYFYSLFTLEENRVEFKTISELIKLYSNKYKKEVNYSREKADTQEIIEMLKKDNEFMREIDDLSKRSKVIRSSTMDDIYSELLWIKACSFNEEEYLHAMRKGREKRISKNSYIRKVIYKLYNRYSELLEINNKYDIYDDVLLAIEGLDNINSKYTHVVVDDSENLTKTELNFVNKLSARNNYSTLSFVLGTENKNMDGWLGSGGKLSTLYGEIKIKNFYFKTKFENEVKAKDIEDKNIDNKYTKEHEKEEAYQYINFKNKNISTFDFDSYSEEKQIFLKDGINFTSDELIEVPIFNEIAAGNPIEINEGTEGDFYLPRVWLEKGKDTFILNVKGDSMIGKNIHDGDLVVIKRQQVAYHNDIVAASVDGEATLKTLKTNGDNPMLMPENDKYKGISLKDKEVYILGIALGVIRKN